MDQVYRRQRFFYDATRKYYLLGRDYTLRHMSPVEDAHILEVACGTGRNLNQINMRYPRRHLYGLDISSEMLRTATAKLGVTAQLAQGDACTFDAMKLFGQDKFDRIVMSYCISMIPQWQSAIKQAVAHLAPDGEVHIVDFGDQAHMPAWFDRGLRNWLGQFHVTPRDGLGDFLAGLEGVEVTYTPLLRTYVSYARILNAGTASREI